mmetsp:Transcript_6321/g.19166  ORF Transcript_6321/g.19166 Transcript_6321/m.19166 type:complete len:93 (+) Transcript_6321:39-317(+)
MSQPVKIRHLGSLSKRWRHRVPYPRKGMPPCVQSLEAVVDCFEVHMTEEEADPPQCVPLVADYRACLKDLRTNKRGASLAFHIRQFTKGMNH